jgi:UDP-N-acetylmuramyl pentapeptide phosphotransferase/UDP-N-acetylglucosamine-1-phosphate transferase
MGDTGALVIGMTLSIMAIHFINLNFALPSVNPYKFNATIAAGACFIMIPLVDTMRIVILRLIKGQSPFKPDKSHVHHAIMRLGKTHSQTTIILGITQLAFILIAVAFRGFSDKYMLIGVIVLSIILSVTIDRMILKKRDVKEILD